jgi:hypothetical protein
MNSTPKLAGLLLLLPLAAGCVARTAPFDQMDRAQITVLRLSQPQAPASPLGQPGLIPGLPGIPPQLQQMGEQVLQGVQNALPGIIPGMQGIPGMPQPQQQQPQFKGFTIAATPTPLTDLGLRDEILDLFGHESNFSNQVQNCFAPGMALVMQRPNAPEVDLLISLSCNQAKIDGAPWPYPVNGFTPEARGQLGKIYEKLWGPVPPGA